MSINFLDVLGLCIDDIEHAYVECKDALTKVLLSSEVDNLDEYIRSELINEKTFSWSDATASMIEIIFTVTQKIISFNYPDLETDYNISGYDSHFYVKDNDLFSFFI